MNLPKPQLSKDVLKAAFLPEWCAAAVLALVNLILAWRIGFRLVVTPHDGLLIGCALAAVFVLRTFVARRGGLIAEYFALSAAAKRSNGCSPWYGRSRRATRRCWSAVRPAPARS